MRCRERMAKHICTRKFSFSHAYAHTSSLSHSVSVCSFLNCLAEFREQDHTSSVPAPISTHFVFCIPPTLPLFSLSVLSSPSSSLWGPRGCVVAGTTTDSLSNLARSASPQAETSKQSSSLADIISLLLK